ncbi:SDR family NAD(P)-dependent oxidoreductase [Streptococcus rifensis]
MKTIIITGATDGIGKHLAKKLAAEGHRLIIHGRNPQKLETTVTEIMDVSPNATLSAYLADFSKMADVYAFASSIQQDFDRIDVLINNAGIFAGSERLATVENIEHTFMLSVQVPYILTTELRPLLETAPEGRVINTSSYMHHFASVKDLDFGMEKDYSAKQAYNNAKLYLIWLTCYQAQQFKQEGSKITINAYHPGLIATNLGNTNGKKKETKSLVSRVIKSVYQSLDEGIETGYFLALSDQVAAISGAYFDTKTIKRVSYKGYNDEKAKALLAYCDQKIFDYKESLL